MIQFKWKMSPSKISYILFSLFPLNNDSGRKSRCRSFTLRSLDFFQKLQPKMTNYILLTEEILHHLGCIKPCKEWDIYHMDWLVIAGFLKHQPYDTQWHTSQFLFAPNNPFYPTAGASLSQQRREWTFSSCRCRQRKPQSFMLISMWWRWLRPGWKPTLEVKQEF